ncbi:MAG: HlyD family efflux transporter periplasmic adaptor subunit [Eubacteriales bacterium]|nr:HlyD family efflux transporter periplasmic adaptor subunit [Eubacteriales bacterium]
MKTGKNAEAGEYLNIVTGRKAVKSGKVFIFVIVIFVVYIFMFFNWAFGRNIRTAVMYSGTVEEIISTTALISRYEEPVISSYGGRCFPYIPGGGRVPAGYRLASVLDNHTAVLADELKEKENELLNAKLEEALNNNLHSGGVLRIDESIAKEAGKLAYVTSAGDIKAALDIINEIDGLIAGKASMTDITGNNNAYVRTLEERISYLRYEIESKTGSIISQRAGLLTYVRDGCEETLKPDAITMLLPEDLDRIAASYKPVKLSPDSYIDKGAAYAKLITEYFYYYVFNIKKDELPAFSTGEDIRIRLKSNGLVIHGKIVSISELSVTGRAAITVMTSEGLDLAADRRIMDIEVIRNRSTGVKVPLKSLAEINYKENTANIVMVEANHAKTRQIVIKGMNSEYAVIENMPGSNVKSVGVFSTYIVNPENIRDGQMIRK